MRGRGAARWSLGTRLAIVMTLALAVVLAAGGALLAVALRAGLRDRAHESLEVPYRVIEQHLADEPGSSLSTLLDVSAPSGEVRDEVIGQLLDADFRVVDSTGGPMARPVVTPTIVRAARTEGEWHEARRLPGRDGDDLVVVVPVSRGAHRGGAVVLAQTLAPSERQVRQMLVGYALVAPIVLLIAFLGGRWIAGAALRPVDRLTREAMRIDPGTSDDRLPVPRSDDEVRRLADALNGMLARLRAEIDRQRRLAADASHELRGPLARMTTDLDVTIRSTTTPPEVIPVLRDLRHDAAGLARIVDDLLILARIDATGGVELAREPTDMLDLCAVTARRFDTVAEARSVRVVVAGEPVVADVDPRLVGHAVSNLLDNAVKFGRPGGTVTVSVSTTPRGCVVTVHDDGPGIPPHALPHVFERFYRADEARGVGGTGLGLAIVESCVTGHGGDVAVRSDATGTTFTLGLPATGA